MPSEVSTVLTSRENRPVPRKPRVPSYRRHKGRNLAVVVIQGRSHYLGPWNSPESRAEYARVVREWAARQGQSPPPRAAREGGPAPDPTVDEVLVAFLRHAAVHYRDRDGRPTREFENVREAVKPLRRLYGHTPAADFGPLALRGP